MDSYQRLCERMETSYQNHHAEWMKLAPSVLIERAKEIAAIQDTREFMAQGRGIDPEGVDFLLTFEDPLQAVANHWLIRMDDLNDFSFALDELCRRQNAPKKKSAMAMLRFHERSAVPPKSNTPHKKEDVR